MSAAASADSAVDRSTTFWEGARAMLPLVAATVPFGVTAGAAAVDAGLPPAAAIASSVLIYAGAAQLAAAQLLAVGAAPAVIVLTAWIINLRFSMYSAALAPHLGPLPPRLKWPLAYLITDQAFALSMLRARNPAGAVGLRWYYFGVALVMWLAWQLSTIAGVALGRWLPGGWSLDFMIPLMFIAMLMPAVRSGASAAAASVGAITAVAAHGLPMNLGLFLGAAAGVAAGLAAARGGEQ